MAKQLPPLRATVSGRYGRKHILAQVRLNDKGQLEIFMSCPKSVRCGCSGWYVLEDLVRDYQGHLVDDNEREEKDVA